MMKSKLMYVVVFALIFVLAGCETRSDANTLYKKENPLEVQFLSKEAYEKEGKHTIHFKLLQDGQSAKDLQFTHISIWNVDHSVTLDMTAALEEKDGTFTFPFNFKKPGLYYVQVHAGTKTETISPTQRLLVGKLSKKDTNALQSNTPSSNGGGGHHH